MSPQLLHAVISVESGYDAKAVSRAGAKGLMQTDARDGANASVCVTRSIRCKTCEVVRCT